MLINAGADQRLRDAYGWTPLMRAAHNGRLQVVRVLLDAPGADLDAYQVSGASVLHIAAASGETDIVELLVARGADRAATDNRGNTAAETAMAGGHVEIAEYLQALSSAAD